MLAEIVEGNASEAQAAAFLIALRTKGETVGEIAGLAAVLRERSVKVDAGDDLVDTAGTGGGRPTFNVSTTAAFIAAGAGCRVAKHGNRSATSQCGSADVLEALGGRIDLEPEAVAECIGEIGFGFMFAPLHHPAFKHIVPVRKELGVRTIFNFLGPLTNPAGALRQVVGVSDPGKIETMAAALGELGAERALVVSSADGLDEFSVSGATRVVELRDGRLSSYDVTPEEVDLELSADGAVGAGTPEQNAHVLRDVLSGKAGTERSLAVLNAGAAIYVAGRADTLAEGVRAAERSIDDGAAASVLERWVGATPRDPAPRRHRRRHPRCPQAAPARAPAVRARGAGRDRARGPPVRRGAVAPRHVADRGAQAPLAVGGRDPRGRELRRDRRARTSAAARPRCRSSPRRCTSADRWRTCARPARPPSCRSCARTSRSTRTSSTRPSSPAPTRCCSWSARSTIRHSPRSTRRRPQLDLDALVEIHDDEELERALELDCDVIGINNRNLEDFSVDIQRTFDLLADVPAGKVVVSESGIHHREQIEELEQVGVDAVLVGEALMRAPDPEAAARELTHSTDPGAEPIGPG